MSVRSVLMMVAAISISAGLIVVPGHANSDLQFNWIRNLNSTTWGYTEAEDPSESGSNGVVERFELRMGDCTRNEYEDDCNSHRERVELVELGLPTIPLNGEVWYRWKMYFPKNYRVIYPARTYHIRVLDKDEKLVWSFEVGSTGVLWLGNYVTDETTYFPLIDEDELLSQWQEFSVHAKWAANSGFFKVWVNTVRKVDYVGPTCRDCRTRISYGILRTDINKFYQSYPDSELPTQVVYYSEFNRNTSGVGYPGYISPQNTNTLMINEPPKPLKPTLIIETNSQNISNSHEIEESKGDKEIPSRDRD